MNFQLTPIVKHLVIINVVIFVLHMVMPANLSWIYEDYFTLHKSNLVGLHDVISVDQVDLYLPSETELSGGTMLTIDNYQDLTENNITLQTQLKDYLFKASKFNPVQIVTHFFTHSRSSVNHIFFNMFMLIMIGPIIEQTLKSERFLKFYLFCGVVGGLIVAFLDPSHVPVVGASGAVLGLTVALAMYYPKLKLHLFFVLPIEAKTLAIGTAVISAVFVFLDYIGQPIGGGISHFGHLAGMVAAFLFFHVERFLPGENLQT